MQLLLLLLEFLVLLQHADHADVLLFALDLHLPVLVVYTSTFSIDQFELFFMGGEDLVASLHGFLEFISFLLEQGPFLGQFLGQDVEFV